MACCLAAPSGTKPLPEPMSVRTNGNHPRVISEEASQQQIAEFIQISHGPIHLSFIGTDPDSKVHGANMGPIWGRQAPGGPHVGPMNFVIWGVTAYGTPSKKGERMTSNA